MSTVVYFKQPRPDTLNLEVLKVQCWRSWFNTQTIPTEIVEALIETVETQRKELTKAKLDAEIYETMYDNTRKEHDELHTQLAQICYEIVQLLVDLSLSHSIMRLRCGINLQHIYLQQL